MRDTAPMTFTVVTTKIASLLRDYADYLEHDPSSLLGTYAQLSELVRRMGLLLNVAEARTTIQKDGN